MRIIRTSRTSKIGGRGERQRGAVASGRRTCRRRCPRASRRRAPSSPCLRCVTRCTPHPPIRPISSPGPDPKWFTLVRDVSRLDRGLDCAVSLDSVTRLSVSRPLPVESQTLSTGLSWALSHSLRRAQPSSLWTLHSTPHSAPRVAESLHSHVTRLDHVTLRA